MPNRVNYTPIFEKYLKKYVKKYPTLPAEVVELEELLIENPKMGTNLGSGIFKIRLATKSKNKGKSGGFRVITYLVTENATSTVINLLMIYDKSDIEDIPKKELLEIIKSLFG